MEIILNSVQGQIEKSILDFLAFGYFLGTSLFWVLADLEEEGAILKWFISLIIALIAVAGVTEGRL